MVSVRVRAGLARRGSAHYNGAMDWPVSVAIAPLPGAPRERLGALRELGARAATLDVSNPDLRPRALDRSARRGLAASLRRFELALGGFDLPIPPGHFADAGAQDRAIAAVRAAVEMLSELGELVETVPLIHLTLPDEEAEDAAREMGRAARELGVTLVDMARPPAEELPDGWGFGVNLGRELEADADPLAALTKRESPASVRLSDAGPAGRVALGEGRLELPPAVAVIQTTCEGAGLVIDVKGAPRPAEAAGRALRAWERAAGGLRPA